MQFLTNFDSDVIFNKIVSIHVPILARNFFFYSRV